MGNFKKHIHPLLKRDKRLEVKDDSNFAILNALDNVLNEAEQDTIKSKIQSSLETATGEFLDRWGDWFGIYREVGEEDDHYREHIIRHTLLPRGTIQSIIDAIKWFLKDNDANIEIYEPWKNIFYTNNSKLNGEDHLMGYYYRFAIIDISIDRPFPPEIIDIIWAFKPAGVLFYVGYDSGNDITSEHVKSPYAEMTIDNIQELDRLTGLGIEVRGSAKTTDIRGDAVTSNIFHTNRSLLNGEDVLAGAFDHGREHIHLYGTALKETGNVLSANSKLEKTGSREFVNSTDWDLAPAIDTNGTDIWYKVTFDLKLALAGAVDFYFQNGTTTKYALQEVDTMGNSDLKYASNRVTISNATTEYKRYTLRFRARLSKADEPQAMLAFFATYNTGRLITVKNLEVFAEVTKPIDVLDTTTLAEVKAQLTELDNVSYASLGNYDGLVDRRSTEDKYLYVIFNIRDYLSINFPKSYDKLVGGSPSVVNKGKYSSFMKNPTISFVLRSLTSPTNPTKLKVKLKDFELNKWDVISSKDLTQVDLLANIEIGNMESYISSEGLIAIQLEVTNTAKVPVDIDYVGYTFTNKVTTGYDINKSLLVSNISEVVTA